MLAISKPASAVEVMYLATLPKSAITGGQIVIDRFWDADTGERGSLV